MINHVRTLLLNKDGSKRPAPDFFYEELVPVEYREQPLGRLVLVRNAIFGASPDNAFLNYRMHQLMKVIHATEYVSYVTALDPRTTYDSSVHSILEPEPSYSVNPMSELARADDIIFLGAASTVGENVLAHNWTTEIPFANVVSLTNNITKDRTDTPFAFTSGLSDIIEFPGTKDLSFRFAINPGVNYRWLISVRKKPSADIYGVISRLESLGEEMSSVLFSAVEPYATFQQVWDNHPWWTYRLAAVALALAYRTEAILNA